MPESGRPTARIRDLAHRHGREPLVRRLLHHYPSVGVLRLPFAWTERVDIYLNGERKTVPGRCTVADLVAQLGLQPRFVAVERNERLIPRTEHAACRLEPDDRIEIVTLVGGG